MAVILFVVPLLVAAQTLALGVAVRRLLPGRRRQPPVFPLIEPGTDATVSVIVPTLNEAERIAPCLAGLQAQGSPLLEVLVVDSRSTDGTRELVADVAAVDDRFRLITDSPLPYGWVGKVWALQTGFLAARGRWILGIDADTVPAPGMVRAIIAAVEQNNYGAASFAPRFIQQTAAEQWVQPAMLVTLIYRCGAAGTEPPPAERVLANGQCFVVRRSILQKFGGYKSARTSFSDDVTLARQLARNGVRVGFLDGSRIIDVYAYRSLGEMWREWGRSFDLKDSTTVARRWYDVAFIWVTMALPVPLLVIAVQQLMVTSFPKQPVEFSMLWSLIAINGALLSLRLSLVYAIRGSYDRHGWTFWLSWLADIPAALRLTISTLRNPKSWRGRKYKSDLAA